MSSVVTNENTKKRNKKRKYILRIILLVLFVFFAYRIVLLGTEPVRTEIIRFGTLEDKINTDGYILRSEYVIDSPADGMLSCIVGEGERVGKNTNIATIFEGKVDENLQSKIALINERISELERSEITSPRYIRDVMQIDNVIAKTVEDVINAAHNGDMSKIPGYKNDLERVITQRLREKGEEVPELSRMEKLIAEKKQLEAGAGANRINIKAPVAGVFSSVIDGFEEYFDMASGIKITPQLLESADQMKVNNKNSVVKGEGVVKIIDNYKWYYAAAVDARWIQDLKVGSYVLVRFPDISGIGIDANIESISEQQDGKAAIVISTNRYDNNIYSARRVNADVIRRAYSGFKVPKSAVRILDDGTSGVYILKDSVAFFRQIEILYSNDEYVIVKEDNKKRNALLLYDEVIVSGTGIEDGKILR